MSVLHIDINTLVYIITTAVMGVGFLWKMKNDQSTTASVIKTELKHMKELHEASKKEFHESLENVKTDLKEDIGRLERKQEESNRIKERLAIVEHTVREEANKNISINMTMLSKLLDRMEAINDNGKG